MTPWGVWRGEESCWPTSAASATLTSASSKCRRSDFPHCRFRCVNGKPAQPHIIFLFYFLLKDAGWSPYGSPAMGRHWCMQDLMRTNLKPADAIGATLSPDSQSRKKHPHPMNIQMASTRAGRWSKSSKCAFKKPLHKHSSSLEVTLSPAVPTELFGMCVSV